MSFFILILGILAGCGNEKEMAQKEESNDQLSVEQEVTTEEINEQDEEAIETKAAEKSFTILEDIRNFGNGTFDPEGTISATENIVSIIEEENKVEVLWVDTNDLVIRRSVSENGNWVEVNTQLYKIEEDIFDYYHELDRFAFIGRTLFYTFSSNNIRKVKQVNFDEGGNVISEKIIEGLQEESFRIGSSQNGDKLVVMGNKIYLSSDPDNPIDVNAEKIEYVRGYYLNLNSDIVTYSKKKIAQDTLYQLNLSTLEPVWDENGEELRAQNLDISNSVVGGFDDNILVFASGGISEFQLYNEKLQLLASTQKVEIFGDSYPDYMYSNIIGDEIHVWAIEEFQGKNSLRLWKIGKSVNGEPLQQ